MMIFMCHCWSRTLSGRGGWIRTTQRNWTPAMIAESTSWRQFGTARFMRESQNQVIYQGSTIWYLEKGIRRKKILESVHWQFNTLGNRSVHSIKIISISQQRPLRPLTLHHQWLDHLPSPLAPRSKSEADQPTTLTNELKRPELRLVFIVFLAFSQGAGNPRI